MRLQLHSTDSRCARAAARVTCIEGMHSRVCIAEPDFDKYGVLDADYEAALERGVPLWVLRKDRTPTPWSGRYLVVVESEWAHRPPWAALTYGDRKAGKPSSSTAY